MMMRRRVSKWWGLLCIKPKLRRQKIAVDWCQLPNDIWGLIVEKLAERGDQIRFRSVCKTWSHLLPRSHLLPLPTPTPWLIHAKHHKKKKKEDSTHQDDLVFSYLDGQQLVQQFELPPAPRGTRCVGCTDTWLITIDASQSRMCVLDPFTRRRIFLPPLRHAAVSKVILSSAPLTYSGAAASDCIAVAITGTGCESQLIYTKPGDQMWYEFKSCKDERAVSNLDDIIFSKDEFYGVTVSGSVHRFDIGAYPKCKDDHAKCFRGAVSFRADVRNYLVNWRGELLHIVKYMNEQNKAESFQVFLRKDRCMWTELKDLEYYSLFLGLNTSVAISASHYHGLQRNCIYFTDDEYRQDGPPETPRDYDMGVFHMEDGTLRQTSFSWSYSPPLWIVRKW